MIRYALKCSSDHSFDSWFQSVEAFDTLKRSGMVACPVCGGSDIEKALMTPGVRPARKRAAEPKTGPAQGQGPAKGPLAAPGSEVETAMAELRRKIEATSDYVGLNFAAEARKMHTGDIPQRSIYGEAKADEARKLAEDGVPVAPLPFIPTRKTN